MKFRRPGRQDPFERPRVAFLYATLVCVLTGGALWMAVSEQAAWPLYGWCAVMAVVHGVRIYIGLWR